MLGGRNNRLEESSIVPVPRPRGLGLTASNSVRPSSAGGKMLSQAAANSRISTTSPTNHNFICPRPLTATQPAIQQEVITAPADRQTHQNVAHQPHKKFTPIINNTIINSQGYRTEIFSQPSVATQKRKINLLTKPPPSQYLRAVPSSQVQTQLGSWHASKTPKVSEPCVAPRKSVKERLVDKPLPKLPFALHRKGLRHQEVLLYPPRQQISAGEGPTIIKPPIPSINLIGPTPPGSATFSVKETNRPPQVASSRSHESQDRLVPPPRAHGHRPLTKPTTRTLSIEQTYKAKYEKERDLAAKLQAELIPTKAELDAERQRLAIMEDQLLAQHVASSQNQKFKDHYKWLYERQKRETDYLREQLKQRSESDERIRTFAAGMSNKVSPVSPEVAVRHKTLAELPCMISRQRDSRREASIHDQTFYELSSSTSHQVLRPLNQQSQALKELASTASPRTLRRSRPTLRIESRDRQNAQPESHSVIHKLPATGCHEMLRRSTSSSRLRYNRLPHYNDGYTQPPSHFSDDSDSDIDEDGNSGSDQHRLHASPELPTPVVQLAQSPSPLVSHPQTNVDEKSSLPVTPIPELDYSPSSSESEGSPRPPEAIYRFGTPKIEAAPAVYRVRFSGISIRCEDQESPAMKMGAWEWCSVPDLGLNDPRN